MTPSWASSRSTRLLISSRMGRTESTLEPVRVRQDPVLIALAGEHRARVAAAHGDHDVGRAHDLVRPGLRVLPRDVDADLGHRRDRGGVHLIARLGAARPGDRPVAGQLAEVAQGHLRATGVVGAQEEDDGAMVVALALDAGQCLQTLAGEPLGEGGQVPVVADASTEVVVRRVEEALDRLRPEGALELLLQERGRGSQHELVLEGDVVAQVGIGHLGTFLVGARRRWRMGGSGSPWTWSARCTTDRLPARRRTGTGSRVRTTIPAPLFRPGSASRSFGRSPQARDRHGWPPGFRPT